MRVFCRTMCIFRTPYMTFSNKHKNITRSVAKTRARNLVARERYQNITAYYHPGSVGGGGWVWLRAVAIPKRYCGGDPPYERATMTDCCRRTRRAQVLFVERIMRGLRADIPQSTLSPFIFPRSKNVVCMCV